VLYALSDLHLGEGLDKDMYKFGEEWKDHSKKIMINWNRVVSDDDYVLVPGDISWAINLDEAKIHLDFIANLNGKKILLRGNHDYWWSSVSKLNSLYNSKGMYFLQNDSFMLDDGKTFICGTRLWKNDSEEKEDIKIYRREIIRAKLSLDSAVRRGCESIIFISHYPLLNENGDDNEVSILIESYPVKKVVFGHIHGSDNFNHCFQGIKNGVEYKLYSADYLDFCPEKV